MTRIVLASGNPGKLRELASLLAPFRLTLIPQHELGITPPEESGDSFLANALLKARHAARCAQLPALADDSGIEVDALDGRPGVFSARYAGDGASDEDNCRRLLEELRAVPEPQRRARYRCVMALVRSAADSTPLIAQGSWEGHIARTPRGAGGFGYDPLFVPLGERRSAAELPPAEKNALSHRGQALRELVARLGTSGYIAQLMKPGRLFVVSAPSGAGKTSLVKTLLESEPQLHLSVSHTTRKRRPTEQEGREYHFVSVPQFEQMAGRGEFLEHARVFDNLYGTSRRFVAEQLRQGFDVILEIDWNGAQQVRRAMPQCVSIFILPPSRAELAARLARRATDSAEIIARRLRDAAADMSHYREFDYVVVNDDFQQAVRELRDIIAGRGAPLKSTRPALGALTAELLAEDAGLGL